MYKIPKRVPDPIGVMGYANPSGVSGNASGGRYFHLDGVPHSLSTVITLSCIVLVLIGCTLIGNTLVCLAVSLVRKLRKQAANYLLVSLAFADLCVGFMVMPLAFLYLIFGRWPFGRVLCDVWTTADVTLCTASILNLCMISVDRYLVIVQPLKYCPKRTSRLMFIYIAIVWIVASLVSLLPITFWHLGIHTFWSPSPPETCQVSQNVAYQLYATMFAFYIPATIIIVVNYKIFKAARRLTLADRRASAFSGRAASTMMAATVFVATTPVVSRHGSTDEKGGGFSLRDILRRSPTFLTCTKRRKNSAVENGLKVDGEPPGDCALLTRTDPGTAPRNSNVWRDQLDPLRWSLSKHLTEALGSRGSSQRSSMKRYPMRGQQTPARSSLKRHRRHSDWPRTGSIRQTHVRLRQVDSTGQLKRTGSCKRRHISTASRETKAMKTLGLITGCFIACWLPFFIVALFKPLCPNYVCSIPGWFENLVLWLGYANSTLNPLLYAKYNKDFRIPFREILCCRLRTLKSVMRMEEYMDTFGSARSSFAPTPTGPQANSNCTGPAPSPVPAPTDKVDGVDGTGDGQLDSADDTSVARSMSSPAVLNRQQQAVTGVDSVL